MRENRCPCLSGNLFSACCGPLLAGERKASTAEQLMRSRFTAFAVGNVHYLMATWHPQTRPLDLMLDPDQQWYRLDIGRTVQGGIFDEEGVVAFRAYYRHPDGPGEMVEVSRFVKQNGAWVYLASS